MMTWAVRPGGTGIGVDGQVGGRLFEIVTGLTKTLQHRRIDELVELAPIGVADAPVLLLLTHPQADEVHRSGPGRDGGPRPLGETGRHSRLRGEGEDQGSRVLGGGLEDTSQNSSRNRTNGGEPKGKTVVSRSTTRWLWKTG